ncbi:MAG: hypothetical protein E6772_03245 [Dysgonomonas sp.]|nr:hypothetical protein [Dysgonomonas sp.]
MKNYFIYILCIIGFLSCNFEKKRDQALKKEYPLLYRDNSISGRVDSFFWNQLSSPRGALLIKLQNNLKFTAFINASSKETEKKLYDFLEKGDSIYKPEKKDSIYIYRNKLKYSFLLNTKERQDSIFHKR